MARAIYRVVVLVIFYVRNENHDEIFDFDKYME